ncbi:MAG: exo-alpha-sialidase [Planctomycetes bacterium]|nr:exo-alpha-sialidase [Planctomycetota bacterium]
MALQVAVLTLVLVAFGSACLAGEAKGEWTVEFDGAALPSGAWHASPGQNTEMKVEDGALRILDRGTERTQLCFVSTGWQCEPRYGAVVEARVKVLACSGRAGMCLLVADGVHEQCFTLYPDRIVAEDADLEAKADLAKDFRVVRVEIKETDFKLRVDGAALLNGAGKFVKKAHEGRNVCGFGSISSPSTGDGLWDFVRYKAVAEPFQLVPGAEHIVVFKQEGIYACFPTLYQMPDSMLAISFGTRVTRSHIDSRGGSKQLVSRDGGKTWTDPPADLVIHNPDTRRADGKFAEAWPTGWREAPAAEREKLEARGLEVRPVREGIVAYCEGAHFRVRDAQRHEVAKGAIQLPPLALLMGFGRPSYLNAGNGIRLVAVYGYATPRGVRQTWCLRTENDGDSWDFVPMASALPNTGFNETALLKTTRGAIIALMRTEPSKEHNGFLFQCESVDGGRTWSAPVNTGIWGYPCHLLQLQSGQILCAYGYRRRPMGVRAVVSRDEGKTWDAKNTFVLRADGAGNSSDLGYPQSVQLPDRTIVTAYYMNCKDNITHVAVTRWRLPAP